MSVSTEPTQEITFSEAIRLATAGAHRDAETAPYLGKLLGGALPIAQYGRLIAQHHAIYVALESFNDAMATDPVASGFVSDDLLRWTALEADAKAVLGDDWKSLPEAELVPATVEYRDRILEVGASWPGGWIGHQYVRYLGDLSGGLHIRGMLERIYDIDETSGTAFYDFPKVPDPVAWKNAYRKRLDDAGWDEDEQGRIVEEVLEAYRLNTLIFTQLGD